MTFEISNLVFAAQTSVTAPRGFNTVRTESCMKNSDIRVCWSSAPTLARSSGSASRKERDSWESVREWMSFFSGAAGQAFYIYFVGPFLAAIVAPGLYWLMEGTVQPAGATEK